MDNCCFNRMFDDRSYPNVYLEHNSVMLILKLIECGELDLLGSDILRKEISDTPDLAKRKKLQLIYSLNSFEIIVTKDILRRAREIREQSNIRLKDSIHLACAESVNADVLLTTDKKFANNANRIPAKIRVMNPITWLMEVVS